MNGRDWSDLLQNGTGLVRNPTSIVERFFTSRWDLSEFLCDPDMRDSPIFLQDWVGLFRVPSRVCGVGQNSFRIEGDWSEFL